MVDILYGSNAKLRFKRKYPIGEELTLKAEMDALSLHRNEFRDDWNYELHPR